MKQGSGKCLPPAFVAYRPGRGSTVGHAWALRGSTPARFNELPGQKAADVHCTIHAASHNLIGPVGSQYVRYDKTDSPPGTEGRAVCKRAEGSRRYAQLPTCTSRTFRTDGQRHGGQFGTPNLWGSRMIRTSLGPSDVAERAPPRATNGPVRMAVCALTHRLPHAACVGQAACGPLCTATSTQGGGNRGMHAIIAISCLCRDLKGLKDQRHSTRLNYAWDKKFGAMAPAPL